MPSQQFFWRWSRGLSAVAALTILIACSSEPPPELACESAQGVEVICGFTRPEDIERAPDGSFLVISEMGSRFGQPAKPGFISFYDVATGRHHRADVRIEEKGGWGDPACTPPEGGEISPHGLNLMQLPKGGGMQLAVVSHYPREAVELLAIKSRGGMQYLVWKGCLLPPENAFINDVTQTPDGRIFMTHMFDSMRSMLTLIPALLLRMDTGYVWSWKAGEGYAKVPGSEGSFPNGISSDTTGKTLFVNYYMDSTVKALNSTTGEVTGEFAVPSPDNVTYSKGNLYVASHEFGFGEAEICNGRKTSCPLPYGIYRIDAETMQGEKIVSGTGHPFGVATVATPNGKWLWMGSYLGDRIAKVPLPDSKH